uniref:Uncharacterized protein n=1 Tax=Lotharella globosa TaxID=91324 RepID=A0A7S3Z7W5_9EUKA|mmetsp:Transcript_22673/g.45583  ORF Transcript_22673/g.45583 Transcript_22673/m.45583 type:complete len:153 (+) Transcript_22673:80-538(+)
MAIGIMAMGEVVGSRVAEVGSQAAEVTVSWVAGVMGSWAVAVVVGVGALMRYAETGKEPIAIGEIGAAMHMMVLQAASYLQGEKLTRYAGIGDVGDADAPTADSCTTTVVEADGVEAVGSYLKVVTQRPVQYQPYHPLIVWESHERKNKIRV